LISCWQEKKGFTEAILRRQRYPAERLHGDPQIDARATDKKVEILDG